MVNRENTQPGTGVPDRPQTSLWSRGRKRFIKILKFIPHFCVGLAAAGLIVRLTVRDRIPILATIDYVVPAIVQAVLFSIAAIGWGIRRKWRRAAPCAIGAVALLFWWHHANFIEGPASPTNGRPRVVLWNVARGELGIDAVVAKLRAQDPDVIALVEAGYEDDIEYWKKQFPEYQHSDWRGGLLVLARGKLVQDEYVRLDNARYMTLRIEAAGLAFRLVIVDLIGNPLSSRKEPIERIHKIVEPWANEPLVVVGDFNTPADSVFFDIWREKMNHAFEQSGDGYFATWPSPLPIMAIDQVWISRSLKSGHCRLIDTLRSDHRLVEFDLARAR